ncbi:MAG: efflux RND transporter permease subunit [Planctomycetota bacterium]
MNSVIAWFARNGVAANLLMVLVLAGGAVTIPRLKQEVFPELGSDLIQITVPYLGATPSEVEESICMRVEEAIQGLSGVKRIRSSAREGMGSVFVDVLAGADNRRLLEDVKSRVDAIDTFPGEAERPIVQEIQMRRQVVNVAVSGKTDEKSLRLLAEQVRDEISQLPSISLVTLSNARPYEISIEVSEAALRRFGLTFDSLALAIRSSSLDLPGGSIRTEGGEILVRTKGQAYRGPDFETIPVIRRPDGTRVLLRDIATVVDGFAQTDQYTRFDGEDSILLQVFRVGDQDALDIADELREYLDGAEYGLPQGISLTAWQDDSKVLRGRLDLMLRNGRMGLIFVFICLALFLRLKLAFWVALGIPISFMGAVWLLPAMDMSINLISLFAFIIVLGIVVDDAIVVGENIYTKVQQGHSRLDAAIEGAKEVATPVTFAVFTTIAAFSPLLLVPGRYGEFMKVVPLIVIATLAFSLLESLFVLPHHLSSLSAKDVERGPSRNPWAKLQDFFSGALDRFVSKFYRPVLRLSLEVRYVTLAACVSLLLVTGALVGAGWIKFVFFPPVDADNVVTFLSMPQGTPVDVTSRYAQQIEDAAQEVRKELNAQRHGEYDDIVRHVLTSIGGQPFRVAQNQNQGQTVTISGAHLAEVNLELVPSEIRNYASEDIAKLWEQKFLGKIPDTEELLASYSIFSSGKDVDVQLASNSIENLELAAEELKAQLATLQGVKDIADSFLAGKTEMKLSILPEAENLGLTLIDLGRQVRQGFYGEEVQRIQRGRDDVKVMLRYPEVERASIADIEQMRIRTPAGDEVPFSSVARVDVGTGFSTIDRTDRSRVIKVTAGVDLAKGNPGEVNSVVLDDFLPALEAKYPGVKATFAGDQSDRSEALESLGGGFVIALLLIYTLLAIPFRSYLQPLIVMGAIPFGLVGAIWGHILMGYDLTFLSIFGIVALTGVVVNDSLVMVDFINRRYRDTGKLSEAIRSSGEARFRPILLTSLTTFAGLTPLLLEKSLQAKFLVPMALSLGFGVLFATVVTLILVPVGYYVLEDLRTAFGGSRVIDPDEPAPLPREYE